MRQNPVNGSAALEAMRAWRLGQIGAFVAAYPHPSEALLSAVLAVDDEVAGYKSELQERELRKMKRAQGRMGR